MDAAEAIAAYKKERGLPVLDASREEALLDKIRSRTPEALQPYSRALYILLMQLSRRRQEELLADPKEG